MRFASVPPRVRGFIVLGLWAAVLPPGSGCRGEREPAKVSPLSPLPPEKLPPRTAAPPDPAREQYRREKVLVRIDEKVEPRSRPAYSPPQRVLEEYLGEYFRRAGFEVAARPGEERYTVEGSFQTRFLEPITLRGQTIALRFEGQVRVSVREKGGSGEPEVVEIPEFLHEGVPEPGEAEEQDLVLQMRRRLARVLWERLHNTGRTFTDPQVPALLASLASDDSESDAPVQARDVVKALVDKRLDAVPYLIEALSDEREVRVHAVYPGLTSSNSGKLRVYHLADKALEEIFQKVSRLDLDTPARLRFKVIQGWENEWRRFCPAYRDSPRKAARPRPPSEAKAGEPAKTG